MPLFRVVVTSLDVTVFEHRKEEIDTQFKMKFYFVLFHNFIFRVLF
jgi:hypothetical protein